jgi:Xaa-Pro aminopeptidase
MDQTSVAATCRISRLSRLRRQFADLQIDAYLVTNFVDVSYLTGFEGDDSFVLVTPDQQIMISDFRYSEQLEREATGLTTIHMRKKGIIEETAALIKKAGIKRLGVQAENLTMKQHQAFVTELPDVTLVPTNDVLVSARHIKDNWEIGQIEQAIAIAEHAFEAVRWLIKPGTTESEIASLLVHEMRKRGASGPSFDTIVGANANGSLPHYRPRQVKIENNSAILIDWGARFGGYCSDLTRVVFLGTPPAKIREIYPIVLDAQQAAIEAIKPGVPGKEIDKIARDIITKAGYGENFGHGTGHGLGRDIHEPISFSKISTTELKPGMVLTVEPGIYLPGIGGVRIEEDVLVTERGSRVLTQLNNDLASAKLEEKPVRRHAIR